MVQVPLVQRQFILPNVLFRMSQQSIYILYSYLFQALILRGFCIDTSLDFKICDGGLIVDAGESSNLLVSSCSGNSNGRIGIVKDKDLILSRLSVSWDYVADGSIVSAEFLSQDSKRNYLYFVDNHKCIKFVNRNSSTTHKAIGDCKGPIDACGTSITDVTGLGILDKFIFISSEQGLYEFDAETYMCRRRVITVSSKVLLHNSGALIVVSEASTGDAEVGKIEMANGIADYKNTSDLSETYGSDKWFSLSINESTVSLISAYGRKVTYRNTNCLKDSRTSIMVPYPPSAFVYFEKFKQTVIAFNNPNANATTIKAFELNKSFTCPSEGTLICQTYQPSKAAPICTPGLQIAAIVAIVLGLVGIITSVIVGLSARRSTQQSQYQEQA